MKILVSLSLGLFAWQTAMAQLAPAEDFFNSGAQLYISNNIPAALERVEMGLKSHPSDEKLKKLEELLKQQQQQQQQQQDQQQQNKDQQSKNDQQKQQQNQQNQSQQQKDQQQKQDQQKQDEQKKSDEEKQKEEQEKQQSADQQKADQDKQQKEQGQPLKPGQMAPEEAKKLLDAQKGDEKLLQMRPEGKPQDSSKPVKDW